MKDCPISDAGPTVKSLHTSDSENLLAKLDRVFTNVEFFTGHALTERQKLNGKRLHALRVGRIPLFSPDWNTPPHVEKKRKQ